jgi:YVTN family beta-propeller protein
MRITINLAVLGMLAGTMALAQGPPAPALLVLHKGDHAMAIVDPSSGKVMGRVSVGQDPHELAVSDDGKLAFASNYGGNSLQGGNSLSVIDIAGRKELHRVELSPLARPHGLWFAGGKLYFTAEANLAIGRYDPATNKVDLLLGTGQERTHMVLVTRDLKTIFTSNVSANTISIIERTSPFQRRFDGPGEPPPGFPGGPPPGERGGPPGGPDGPPPGGPDGPPPGDRGGPPGSPDGPPPGRMVGPPPGGGGPGWKQTTVSVGRGPEGFDLAPDGKELWTAHMGDGHVSVIDVATRKVVRTIDAAARGPNRLKFTTDGKRVLISEIAGGGLIVLDSENGSLVKRLPLGRGASGILVAPDGARAFVALTGDNVVVVINLATLTEEARLHTGSGPDGMAWLGHQP